MNKILVNFLLLICFGCLLLPQPGNTLRIKRADKLANATDNLKDIISETPLANALNTSAIKPQVKIMDTAKAAAAAVATATATNAPEAAAAAVAATAAATKTAATAAIVADAERKQEQLDEDSLLNDLAARMHHSKRRNSLFEEPMLLPKPHHGRHHNAGGSNAVPPYVYFNKLVSPDGKQELKEFQLLGPNVVIESLQHDMNYGPGAGDMGGMTLLNADNIPNGRIHGMAKPKHHHKHKASLALSPFLFLLQQMLQPNLNIDLMDAPMPTPPQMPRNRMDVPLYQFIDSAVDNALRNNHEIFNDRERDSEMNDKDKDKDDMLLPALKAELKKEELKEAAEQMNNRKEDELVVSCPIHHEHHAANNGEILDDDVVLVNECHII